MPIRFLLHRRLQDKNLPLSWLAYEAGMSLPALRRLKNERAVSIKFDTLARLCEALNCAPSEFFELVPTLETRKYWRQRRDYQIAVLKRKLNAPSVPILSDVLIDDEDA